MKRSELKLSSRRVKLNIIAINCFIIIKVIRQKLGKLLEKLFLIVKVIIMIVILIVTWIKLTNLMFTFQMSVRIRMKKLKKSSLVKM